MGAAARGSCVLNFFFTPHWEGSGAFQSRCGGDSRQRGEFRECDRSWVCCQTVEEFLVIRKLLVLDLGLNGLLHEVPCMSFADMVFGSRGEGNQLGSCGATVYGGSVGPEPESQVLWECSASGCCVKC